MEIRCLFGVIFYILVRKIMKKLIVYLSLKNQPGVIEKVCTLEELDKSGFTFGSATH